MTNKSSIRKLQLAIAAITGEDPHRAPVDARIHQPSSAAPVPGRKSSHEGAALHRTLALPAASCVAQTVAALHCPSEAMPNSAIVNSCDSYDPKEKSFPAQWKRVKGCKLPCRPVHVLDHLAMEWYDDTLVRHQESLTTTCRQFQTNCNRWGDWESLSEPILSIHASIYRIESNPIQIIQSIDAQ